MEDSKPKIKNTSDKYELFIHGFGLFRITIEIRRGGNHPHEKATELSPVAFIELLDPVLLFK